MSAPARALRLVPAVVLSMVAGTVEAADKYQIVVHWTNSVSGLKPDVVAAIFMRKAVKWPDGREVVPVDQSLQSAVREAFTREVLGDTLLGVQSYWQQQIAAGRKPPLTKGSDNEVQDYIEKNPNAIGYVSGDAKLKSTIKSLKVKR